MRLGASKELTWAEAESAVAAYFSKLESESHPAKDAAGEPLYEFIIENLQHKELGRPQTVDLKALLDDAFSSDTPDLQPLKRVLVALIEDGQRHTFHQHQRTPVKGVHPCARQKPHTRSPTEVYCKYGFPRDLQILMIQRGGRSLRTSIAQAC